MRRELLVIGFATMLLAGCGGGSDGPPVVQVSDGGGSAGMSAQPLEEQLINLQNQVNTLRQRVDDLESRLPPPQ